MPKVTILLTSYNHADYIKESIESVLSQTFGDFELLIVDDCSLDSSFDIIKSIKDERITAVRNERNMGPEYAFELLHKTAKGQYVAIADSDNLWRPDKLQKQVDFLDSHPEYTAVFTKVNFIDRNGSDNSDSQAKRYNVFNVENRSRQEWLRKFFFEGNCLCHPSVLVRREAYKECGMTADGMWQLPDFYKWVKLCLKHEIYVLDEELFCFRLHGNNISRPDSIKSLFRISNEESLIFSLFYELNEDDFKKVFREETDVFVKNGKINTGFALSKIMLSLDKPAAKTIALKKLFDMLNSPAERAELSALYNYDDVSYKEDETANIPYIRNPFAKVVKEFAPRLYFDFGGGYDESNTLGKSVFPDLDGSFSVTFSGIKQFCGDKAITALRFDPDDRCVRIKIDRMACDGKEIPFEANKADAQFYREGEYDVFYTVDPSYSLYPAEKNIDTVKIEGSIFELEQSLLTKSISKLAMAHSQVTAKLNETKNHAEHLEKVRLELTAELEKTNKKLSDTSAQLNLTLNSISWRLTKPLRAVKKFFKR